MESLTAVPKGFQFRGAERLAFGLELELVLVLPADHQPLERLGLDDLAGIRIRPPGAPSFRRIPPSTGFRSERRTNTAS
jgi:hypothetical protein